MNSVADKPSISFIVPALNEERNIAGAVRTCEEAADGIASEYEIILVDDGSQDGTGELMDDMARANPNVRVVHNPRNLGFGGAFKAGLAVVTMDYVVRVCGDDQVPVAGVRRILGEIGKADFVVPFIANPAEFRSYGRRFGSWGFTRLVNLLFGLRVPYYNHCVVFRRDAVQSIRIATDGFAYQAEALVKLLRAGYSFTPIGVNDIARIHGKSTALRPKNLLRVVHALGDLFWEIRKPGAIPEKLAPSRGF
jgi:glycosyltransferase involved in cell wall biosynthesis